MMEYILAISQVALSIRDGALTFQHIHNIILRTAISIQRKKTIDAGKAWRNYDKQARSPTFLRVAANKTIRTMINWGLLKKVGKKVYDPTNDLLEIGNYVSEKREIEYKRHILDSMVRNEPELAFTPSRYLIPIRDFILPASFSTNLENLPDREAFPRTASHIKKVLKVNMVDFDMMSVWGQFFNFTNVFNPKIINIDNVKQFYLTCWVASVAELNHTYKMIAENGKVALSDLQLNSTRRGLEHSITLLKQLNLIDFQQRMAKVKTPIPQAPTLGILVKKLAKTGATIISEDNKDRGIKIRENLNPANVFVILPRKVSDKEFNITLARHYRFLKKRFGSPYVWISQLRALCCRELGIQDQIFDESLTASYHKRPEKFEFSMIGGDATRGRIRPFGKPFRLHDQIFRIIRLEDQLLD